MSKTPSTTDFVGQLFEEQSTPLLRYLAARFGNVDEAREVAQEAWLRMFRLDTPEQLDNPKAFLFQTASNLAIDEGARVYALGWACSKIVRSVP